MSGRRGKKPAPSNEDVARDLYLEFWRIINERDPGACDFLHVSTLKELAKAALAKVPRPPRSTT